MDERFIYFRDKNKQLRAVIGYLPPNNDGNVPYACLIVSPSEPLRDVTKKEARRRLRGRLRNHGEWVCTVSQWKPHKPQASCMEEFHTHGKDSAYEYILQAELDKIGSLPKDTLKSKVKYLRELIKGLSD